MTFGHPAAFPLHFLLWQYLVLFVMGAGVVVLIFYVRLRVPWVLVLAGASSFLGLGFFEDLYYPATRAPWYTLAFGVASAVVIYGLVTLENEGHLAVPRWLTRLGDASYALYLLHFPLISLLCKVAIVIGLSGIGGASLAYVAIFAITIASAVVFHLYIEQPLLSWVRDRIIPRRSVYSSVVPSGSRKKTGGIGRPTNQREV
jgi:exopolysaccharide production protein ExoZ